VSELTNLASEHEIKCVSAKLKVDSKYREIFMTAIFQSLGKTVLAGVVILVALLLIASSMGDASNMSHAWGIFVMRWLHVLAGTMWIGILWYFNFVQMPSMPKIPDEQKPAIGKVIAPAALFWFRYGALATVVTGVILAQGQGYLTTALSFGTGYLAIGIGMWMALVMAANVWFIIWPAQKKALGIVTVEAAQKAAAAKIAMMGSRFNTMLSIPMLYMMVAQQNGGGALLW
tara:strand:+ start:299 stop:991 length:693 start_codon:yes stop_codon:yes gene_type:complete